jgi:hypothetical protein
MCLWIQSTIGTAHAQNLDMNMYVPSKTRTSSYKMIAKIDLKENWKSLTILHTALKQLIKLHSMVLDLLHYTNRQAYTAFVIDDQQGWKYLKMFTACTGF